MKFTNYFIALALLMFISNCSRDRISDPQVSGVNGSVKASQSDVTCLVNGEEVVVGNSWTTLSQKCTCVDNNGVGEASCTALQNYSSTTTTTTETSCTVDGVSIADGQSHTFTSKTCTCNAGTTACQDNAPVNGCKRRDVVIPLGTKEYKFPDGEQCDCDEYGYLCFNAAKGECIMYETVFKVGESKTFGSQTCTCAQGSGIVTVECN